MNPLLSPMAERFRQGVASYQPEIKGFALENGDPQVSLANIRRLTALGLVIRDFWVRPTGTLVMFASGEQYYSPGLRVGTDGPATEALAEIAAEAKFGPYERLLAFYRSIPPEYDNQLPDVEPELLDGVVPVKPAR